MKSPKTDVELAQHIIEFDPHDISTHARWTVIQPELLAKPDVIPWPVKLAPKQRKLLSKIKSSDPLPRAEVVVITWTVAEAQALADIFTPGHPLDRWKKYDHLFKSAFEKNIRKGAPASKVKRLGSYSLVTIKGKKVLCFKSELHLSQDGPKLPLQDLFKQIIREVKPKLVITTGTAGAIGADVKLGDIIVGRKARFVCKATFKHSSFNNVEYTNQTPVPITHIQSSVENLLSVNAHRLPPATRTPTIYYDGVNFAEKPVIVTTDFFAYDNTSNTYQLQDLGAAVEMDDAVLAMVCQGLGNSPDWFAVRNASDPQIDGSLSLAEQKKEAAKIYEKYGYWTTVGSVIATWAIIAGWEG